jgi:hypothetical protein
MHTTVLTLWIAGSVTKESRFLVLPQDVTKDTNGREKLCSFIRKISSVIVCGFLIQGILRQTSLLHAAKIFVGISRFLGEAKFPFLLRKTATYFCANNTALRAPVLIQPNPVHTQFFVINFINIISHLPNIG